MISMGMGEVLNIITTMGKKTDQGNFGNI